MSIDEDRRAKAVEYALDLYRGRNVACVALIDAAAVIEDFMRTGAGAPDITIKVEGGDGVSARDIRDALLTLKRRTGGAR